MRRGLALALVAVLALSFRAAAVDLETTPYLARVFREGERIEYSLSWLGIVGGTAVMRVEPEGGRIRFTSIARSEGAIGRLYPVRDEIESVVDRKSFSTVRFHKILNERRRHKDVLTEFDTARNVARYKGTEVPYEPPIFDPLSTIYYIRTLDLSPGTRHEVTLIADDEIYELAIVVQRRETLRIDGSVFRTVVVEPKMRHGGVFRDENNRLLIWYTDDARRVPVRIRSDLEFGHITATIRNSRLGGEGAAGEAGEAARSQ